MQTGLKGCMREIHRDDLCPVDGNQLITRGIALYKDQLEIALSFGIDTIFQVDVRVWRVRMLLACKEGTAPRLHDVRPACIRLLIDEPVEEIFCIKLSRGKGGRTRRPDPRGRCRSRAGRKRYCKSGGKGRGGRRFWIQEEPVTIVIDDQPACPGDFEAGYHFP